MPVTTTDVTYIFDIEVKQLPNRSDDIKVYILDEPNFLNYKKYFSIPSNQRQYSKIDWDVNQRTKVYWGTLIFEPPELGNYYLVLSNTHSSITAKTVVLKARVNRPAKNMPQIPEKGQTSTEGAIMVEPGSPWSLGQKIVDTIKACKSEILISSPYIDNSTFSMINSIEDQVQVKILISEDYQITSKVEKSKITSKHIQTILSKKKIGVRKITNLHVRLLLADKSYLLFLSSDLQTDSLATKYQLGHWTTNSAVVNASYDYFMKLWNDAEDIDFVNSLKQLENKDSKAVQKSSN